MGGVKSGHGKYCGPIAVLTISLTVVTPCTIVKNLAPGFSLSSLADSTDYFKT